MRSFGGAYLGAISVKIPSFLGFSYRPTQRAELMAAVIGLIFVMAFWTWEEWRKRKARTPIKFGR